MADVEDRDIQALQELQGRMIDLDGKQKAVDQQVHMGKSTMRRAALTARELSEMADDVSTYQGVGRAYILTPKADLMSSLQTTIQTSSEELNKLKESQASLDKSKAALEGEIRELLQNNTALAQAFLSQAS